MSFPVCCYDNTLWHMDRVSNAGVLVCYWFQELGVAVTHSNTEVVCDSDLVFITVKPHLVPPVLSQISPHITDRHVVVSVAAGVTIATLEEVCDALRKNSGVRT